MNSKHVCYVMQLMISLCSRAGGGFLRDASLEHTCNNDARY